jgi:CHAD domain-containing protein
MMEEGVAKPTQVPGITRSTPLATGGPLILRARLADARRYEAVLAREGEPDADAVHDMRVAARRVRAAIEALGDEMLRSLEEEVKGVQDALGAVRDIQVIRDWIAGHGRGDGASRLAAAVGSRLPEAVDALGKALDAWRGAVAPTILELSTTHAGAPGTLSGAHLARAVRRRLDKMAQRIPPVLEDPSPRAAHRLRIAAKKVRYLAEVARPGRERAAKVLLEVLEPMQERLGQLHDADVRTARLEELAASGPAEGRAEARRLLAAVRRERDGEARALVHELRRWSELDVVARVRRGFRRRERAVQQITTAERGGQRVVVVGR